MEKIDYNEDYYKGVAKIYFNSILDNLITWGKLNEETVPVLDYGCGVGKLKQRMKNKNVIGYDIIPTLSDVEDYKTITTNKIVCSGILEHMSEEEIDKVLNNFINMNPKHELLVFLPTENIVSKIGMYLSRQTNAHSDHITKYKNANTIIEKYYKIKRRKMHFLGMAQLTHYVLTDIVEEEKEEKDVFDSFALIFTLFIIILFIIMALYARYAPHFSIQ